MIQSRTDGVADRGTDQQHKGNSGQKPCLRKPYLGLRTLRHSGRIITQALEKTLQKIQGKARSDQRKNGCGVQTENQGGRSANKNGQAKRKGHGQRA